MSNNHSNNDDDAHAHDHDDGDAPTTLPPISRALLSLDDLVAYFRDLRALATIESIHVKSRSNRTAAASPGLDDAEQALLASAIDAVQIRYQHDHFNWFDTLTRTAAGFMLVRMRHGESLTTTNTPDAQQD